MVMLHSVKLCHVKVLLGPMSFVEFARGYLVACDEDPFSSGFSVVFCGFKHSHYKDVRFPAAFPSGFLFSGVFSVRIFVFQRPFRKDFVVFK